ncbi:hypothetical protein QYM36_011380 [Artemia franciscana]|uniref:RRM domain-containing protein n=1 Tax=Artemia franciscana TaxID=6661 RepID=A0AA88HK16_ARTSF|nr:hypothetical protein QYM36_011380 [Artemia franciscana]
MPDIQSCSDALDKLHLDESNTNPSETKIQNGGFQQPEVNGNAAHGSKQNDSHLENGEETNSDELKTAGKTNLIINYLPATYGDIELLSLFSRIGEIADAKVARDKQTGLSYGFGFVNFVRTEDALLAIEKLNGCDVQNKRIKVSFARPPGENRRQTNLYIQNLPKTLTDSEFVKMFECFGSIIQSNLLRDKKTGLPRGAGFIRYDTKQEAEVAIKEMNKKQLEGSSLPLVVKVAEEDRKAKVSYYAGMQMGLSAPNASIHTYLLDYNMYGKSPIT